jgi:Methylase involved in ubiquinone/menaquinone biosynthesis
MSNILISGLTAITTIQVFDGWHSISNILEEFGTLAVSIQSKLPENRFLRTTVYVLGSVVLLRAMPFILRRFSFFEYYEIETIYFHRSCNDKEILSMKEELLKELKSERAVANKYPLLEDEKMVILELNVGSGTNFSYYPDGAYIIGTDFMEDEKEKLENNFMLSDSEESKLTLNRFVHTRTEELASVPDNSVSCVVSFHALCSARRMDRSLAEIRRVLMPGGRLFFVEHTAVKKRFTLMWLMQVNFSLSLFTVACCIRETEKFIEQAGFSKVSFKQKDIVLPRARGPLKALSPHVYGYAIK